MNTSSLAGHTIELLDRVVKSSLPTDRVVQDFYRERRYLGSHDRRWITERLYGIIRNFILLRNLWERCGTGLLPLTVFLSHEILMNNLDKAAIENDYGQLLATYKLSGRDVELDKHFECIRAAFKDLHENAKLSTLLYSFPEFFIDLLQLEIRDEAVPIMTALNREAKVSIRVDTNRISRDEVVRRFSEEGIEVERGRFSPMGLYLSKRINLNNEPMYKDGLIEIQEEASQLIGLLVDPRKDETIVDACAGAGGKSLEMAAISGGESKIYALDVDDARLQNLGRRALRSGYMNIERIKVENNGLGDAARLSDSADKVVVDAPCSGSGTIRRNPDKKFRMTREAVERFGKYQIELLRRYAGLVKPGGLLVYSTCSIFEIENSAVVKTFLASDERFNQEDVSHYLKGQQYSELIDHECLMIYPHRHEMDGFFAAVMRRRR